MAGQEEQYKSPLEFPCEFPVKIMGRAADDFEDLVSEIVSRHDPDFASEKVSVRASRDGNFVSLTVIIVARSREQLDDLYRELSAHERILMAL
jgi:putative lipoic acid-binding regulatory protein